MLARHPSIVEVAVVGVPDEKWGERVVAFCVATGEPRRDIEDAVVPHEWSPKQWVRVDEMPLLPNGKVDRMKLKAMA
jgi:O-succinylbenzoic acid--CoA ligase